MTYDEIVDGLAREFRTIGVLRVEVGSMLVGHCHLCSQPFPDGEPRLTIWHDHYSGLYCIDRKACRDRCRVQRTFKREAVEKAAIVLTEGAEE